MQCFFPFSSSNPSACISYIIVSFDILIHKPSFQGFRPIEPGSGVEFSKALGGNRPREQFTGGPFRLLLHLFPLDGDGASTLCLQWCCLRTIGMRCCRPPLSGSIAFRTSTKSSSSGTTSTENRSERGPVCTCQSSKFCRSPCIAPASSPRQFS